jgi:hypothetical protein
MKDFLCFKRMLMPWLLALLFWLGCLMCVIISYYCIIKQQWSTVFVLLVLAPLGLRLVCEWLILAFRINETLTDIKKALEAREKL